jgi:polysaccharide export outer membrane protein
MERGIWAAVLAVGIALMTGGCASEATPDLNRRLISLERVSKRAPDATYLVDPPDVIKVEVLNEAAATREVTVGPDGCVTLLYLGDVKVSRMSTAQIRNLLEKKYQKFYKEPKILVTVTAFKSKRVYVYGEVVKPGAYPYTGSQTAASAIGDANGVTTRAAWSRVKVIRGDPNDPDIFSVNLNYLLLEGDTRQDVSLSESDVVYVPPTVLAWIGYQIDALLHPFSSLFSTFYVGQETGAVPSPYLAH